MAQPFTYFQNSRGQWFARDQYGNVSDVGSPNNTPIPTDSNFQGWASQFPQEASQMSGGIGTIDIPPASMNDPYAQPFAGAQAGGSFGTFPAIQASGSAAVGDPFAGVQGGGSAPGTGSMGSFGTAQNFGFPDQFSLGSDPSSTYSYMGMPGDQSGTSTATYGDPSGTGFAGSGSLSFSEPTPIPTTDPGFSDVGPYAYPVPADPTGWTDTLTQYSPQPDPFAGGINASGAGSIDYGTGGIDASGAGAIPSDIGVTADGTAKGTPQDNIILVPSIKDPMTGGFGVGSGSGFGVTPGGFSTGYTPFGGGGVGPQFSPGGIGGGTGGMAAYGPTSYMHGGVDPFGGGTGGAMPAGFSDPSGSIMSRGPAVGEGGMQTKHGIDPGTIDYSTAIPQPQYISGWQWQKNTQPGPGASQKWGSGVDALDRAGLQSALASGRGWWSPIYTLGTGTDVAQPTVAAKTGKG